MKRNRWPIITLAVVVVLANGGSCDSSSPPTQPPLTEGQIRATDQAIQLTADYIAEEATREAGERAHAATATARVVQTQAAEEATRRAREHAQAETATAEFVQMATAESATATAEFGEAIEAARRNRLVIVRGVVNITDDESWPFDDEHKRLDIDDRATLNPNNPTRKFIFEGCAGGETRVEIHLTVSLESDNSAKVKGLAELFEGTSCHSNDREDDEPVDLNVLEGATALWEYTLLSRGTGGGDKGEISITIENAQQP